MYGAFKEHLQSQLNEIESNGLFKRERVITTPQNAVVKVNGKDVIIFCACHIADECSAWVAGI